jgi:hypothetical protein
MKCTSRQNFATSFLCRLQKKNITPEYHIPTSLIRGLNRKKSQEPTSEKMKSFLIRPQSVKSCVHAMHEKRKMFEEKTNFSWKFREKPTRACYTSSNSRDKLFHPKNTNCFFNGNNMRNEDIHKQLMISENSRYGTNKSINKESRIPLTPFQFQSQTQFSNHSICFSNSLTHDPTRVSPFANAMNLIMQSNGMKKNKGNEKENIAKKIPKIHSEVSFKHQNENSRNTNTEKATTNVIERKKENIFSNLILKIKIAENSCIEKKGNNIEELEIENSPEKDRLRAIYN